jgi:hypothetical protein
MRVRFGLSTLLAIVALTVVFSWLSWNISMAHGDPISVSAEGAESLGVNLPAAGKPLIVSSTIYGECAGFIVSCLRSAGRVVDGTDW